MKLPNAHISVVERAKIVEYLLNPAHPDNGGKAAFFMSLGFLPADWETFADALRRLASNSPVSFEMESVHGKKYIVDGPVKTPAGRSPVVRTV